MHGVQELLRYDKLDDVNATLILKISDCFIRRYVNNDVHEDDPNKSQVQPTTAVDF